MSVIACERLAKPRSVTMASSADSIGLGSDTLMRLTLRWPDSEHLGVTIDLPGADGKMVGLPFLRLVGDELVAQFLAQGLFDQWIGGEGGDGLLQCLGEEIDAAAVSFRFRNRVEIVFIGRAWINAGFDAVQPGGQRQGRRQIGVDRAIGIARFAAATGGRHPHRIGCWSHRN